MGNRRLISSHRDRIEHEYQKPLSAVLRDLRMVQGLSQPRIARRLGVGQSTVSGWLRQLRGGALDAQPASSSQEVEGVA